MTEAQTGSDPFSMTTSAEKDRDGYRVSGSKMFVRTGQWLTLP